MLKTIAFCGTVPSRSEVVLSSRCIVYAYRLKRIACRFPPGCQNLVKLRFLIADDSSVGIGAAVSGVSVLRENSDVDYVVGDDDTKIIDHEVSRPTTSSYLKVHAVNDDFSDHWVDVQITIEYLEQEGG